MSKGISELIGVVPAAGVGSRLFPYPNAKELFPVGHQQIKVNERIEKRPKVISQYLIENMINGGVRRFFFILGEGKHDIMSYYGNGSRYDVDIAYLFQEYLHGMPFAIDLIYPWLRGDETIVMGMPDTIIEPRDAFAQLLNAHREWNADLTLGLFRTDKPSKFGMIGIDDESNVIEHVDKPSYTDLRWLWGVACWGMAFTNLMHEGLSELRNDPDEIILGKFFDLALAHGLRVKGLPFEGGRYVDVGTYDDLRYALQLYA